MPSNIRSNHPEHKRMTPKALWNAKMAEHHGRHKDWPVLGDEKPLLGKPENHLLKTEKKKMQIHPNTAVKN